MRRHCETLKLLLSIVGGVVFIYGFYTYNALYARCRRTEESNDKLQQLHESLSSQLQIVYEHKSRLEKTVQQEKLTHSKDRDEWEFDRDELNAKQKQLAGRLDSVNRDLGLLQSRYEELESDYSKLQEDHHKLTEDHRLLAEQHDDEYRQYKVDCENQLTKLKDQVSEQKRRVDLCQAELDANDKRAPAAPQPPVPQQHYGASDNAKVVRDVQRAADTRNGNMPALDRSALGVGDKPRANIPVNNAPVVESLGVKPGRERKRSAVKASAVNLQAPQPPVNRGDDDGGVKLRRAGVLAQDSDINNSVNGRQQAAAPRMDRVAGGGAVRRDSHIADKRIGDSEPEINAQPPAVNDQVMGDAGRVGRLDSAGVGGGRVAAGGQGHHAAEEDADNGAAKDVRDDNDDSQRPVGQQDGGDADDNGGDVDENRPAAAAAVPINHPPAAGQGQVMPDKNKDDETQYDGDYKDDNNQEH